MKKFNKLAATVAMALSLGVSSQVSAIGHTPTGMHLSENGRGDVLLFPVFFGWGENTFAINNNSAEWVQGHLRFHGAGWCPELLDFEVILSPGDVFVFRLADVDGDGYWEIDQTLEADPKDGRIRNFEYTGLDHISCVSEKDPNVTVANCLDQNKMLIPEPNSTSTPQGSLTPELIDHTRQLGYVVFVGEGVFDGLTHSLMEDFINKPGTLAASGQREAGNKKGTHLWSWVQEAGANADQGPFCTTLTPGTCSRTASDVPNVLSGTAFITAQAGQSQGITYNALAIENFRTSNFLHRIDNYSFVDANGNETLDPAVIIHNEDGTLSDPGKFAYLFGYKEGDNGQWDGAITAGEESRISYNNTWGPSLADGDDYCNAKDSFPESEECTLLRQLTFVDNNGNDGWDADYSKGQENSIHEVEAAIRSASSYGVNVSSATQATTSRQSFTGFYFDKAQAETAFLAVYPTKFIYGESDDYWIPYNQNLASTNATDSLVGQRSYVVAAAEHAMFISKPYQVEVWDTFENIPSVGGPECPVSPCPPEAQVSSNLDVSHEVGFFTVSNLKSLFPTNLDSWEMGRVVLTTRKEANLCTDDVGGFKSAVCRDTFPGLIFGFEIGQEGGFSFTNWRSLQR